MPNHLLLGARTSKTKDPLLSEAKIHQLAERRPDLAVQNPNCPEGLFLELAKRYPLLAMANPSFDLFRLSSPEKWANLEESMARAWIDNHVKRLSPKDQRLFAVDCARRTLSFLNPGEETEIARHCLRVATEFAHGRVDSAGKDETWSIAFSAARSHEETISHTKDHLWSFKRGSRLCALWSVAYCLATGAYGERSAQESSEAIGYSGDAAAWTENYQERYYAAIVWAWRRLVEYLRGNARPLTEIKGRQKGWSGPDMRQVEPILFQVRLLAEHLRDVFLAIHQYQMNNLPPGYTDWIPSARYYPREARCVMEGLYTDAYQSFGESPDKSLQVTLMIISFLETLAKIGDVEGEFKTLFSAKSKTSQYTKLFRLSAQAIRPDCVCPELDHHRSMVESDKMAEVFDEISAILDAQLRHGVTGAWLTRALHPENGHLGMGVSYVMFYMKIPYHRDYM